MEDHSALFQYWPLRPNLAEMRPSKVGAVAALPVATSRVVGMPSLLAVKMPSGWLARAGEEGLFLRDGELVGEAAMTSAWCRAPDAAACC